MRAAFSARQHRFVSKSDVVVAPGAIRLPYVRSDLGIMDEFEIFLQDRDIAHFAPGPVFNPESNEVACKVRLYIGVVYDMPQIWVVADPKCLGW